MGSEAEGFQPDGSAMDRLAGLAGLGHMVTVDRALLACALRDAIRMCQAEAANGDPEAPEILAEYEEALAVLNAGREGNPELDRLRAILQQGPDLPASLLPVPQPAAERDPSLPDGEYARVEIMGHDEHTGWVTESTRAGQPVMVIRGWDGLVIAEVPGHALYRFLPLPTPLRRPEPRAAIAAAYADAAEDFGESGYDDEGRWP